MVGYDPNKEQLSEQEHMTAGAVSGVATRVVAQPLDVLKVRFQLQVEPIGKHSCSKYHGVTQAVTTIWREEGVTAFWKGHVPAQLLSVAYGVVQFGSFEVLTKYAAWTFPSTSTKEKRLLTHLVCGGLAGCMATLTAQPFDVIRTRLVAQGKQKTYRSVLHASSCMWHQEGFFSFYRGLVPTLVQIVPQTGFQFMFYSLFNMMWNTQSRRETSDIGLLQSLVCGSGAGVCSKVAVYPLDVAKKRLQVLGFEKGRAALGRTMQYRGFFDCIQRLFMEEGLRGLYKGLSPSLIKAAVTAACNFCVYEQVCIVLSKRHHRT